METDCNPVETPSNTGFEEDSDYRDFEGTDVKDMRLEAEAVVNDVLFAVSNMFVSKTLPCAEDVAYINVETRERNRYCLELTEAGLRVVAYDFDQTDDRLQTPYHETVYSLLDSLSPAYREVFGNALLQRLEALKKESEQVSVASYNNQKNWSLFKVSLSKALKQYIETECYIYK